MTLLVAVLALAAAGCGGDDDEGASSTGGSAEGSIWVLLPDSASSDRWEKDDRRFFEEAFKAEGVEYNIVNAEGDANTQLQQAEQAINAGAKVILLVNLSPESGATIIQNARDADVKVVDYDRLTAAGPGADVYVSFDNVKVGQTMADTVGPVIDELGGEAEGRDDERRADGQQLEALQGGLQRDGRLRGLEEGRRRATGRSLRTRTCRTGTTSRR